MDATTLLEKLKNPAALDALTALSVDAVLDETLATLVPQALVVRALC